jgi:hypothetical protein
MSTSSKAVATVGSNVIPGVELLALSGLGRGVASTPEPVVDKTCSRSCGVE